jgi:aryl-alcohol dehydrogenase-like predicted oxidoreductase
MKRILGRSGIKVSGVGMGCWAIGGPWTFKGETAGWGTIDDAESIRAIHAALDMGVNFFDTAANYGCGHSERVLGQAIRDRRDQVVIATKFGYKVDESTKNVEPYDGDEVNGDVAGRIREDCEASLARLGTEYIDVYQLHVWGHDVDRSVEVVSVLEELVSEGKIRTYGWSTDRIEAIKSFAEGPNCAVVQQQLNIFDGNLELLHLCEELDLKFSPDAEFAIDDIRSRASSWFTGLSGSSVNPEWLAKLDSVRDILTSEGRSLAQGALSWIWASSQRTIPIPGFKTVGQVKENAGAMEFGPLTRDQMEDIDSILGRKSVLSSN